MTKEQKGTISPEGSEALRGEQPNEKQVHISLASINTVYFNKSYHTFIIKITYNNIWVYHTYATVIFFIKIYYQSS